MVLLPIIDRELRVVARRPSTQWMRMAAAALALVIYLLFLATARKASQQSLGSDIFGVMICMSFALAALSGVLLTADTLSAEKRSGTLGLLFLTDLRGHDVVLGKLVVSSVHAVFGLMAVFPILSVPLVMGGVGVGEFCRSMGALAITLTDDEVAALEKPYRPKPVLDHT